LVIGTGSRFTRATFGGLVAGELNTIRNIETSVVGGADNIASGEIASVLGGCFNRASGFEASISGGQANTSSGALGQHPRRLRNHHQPQFF
jgi:trimeric autotransporter adhesin